MTQYSRILKSVGEFGPWQAGRVAILWVFMFVLGAMTGESSPKPPDTFLCPYPGCENYDLHWVKVPPNELIKDRIMGRRPEYNSSVDPLDWLTFVFPRFADYYQEAQKDRTDSIKDPSIETWCLINVPQIDSKGVCRWDKEVVNRPGNNWTFTCPSGSGVKEEEIQHEYFIFPDKYLDQNIVLCDRGYSDFIQKALTLAGCFSGVLLLCCVSSQFGRIPAIALGLLFIAIRYFTGLVAFYPSPLYLSTYFLGECGWYGLLVTHYCYLVEIIGFNKKVFRKCDWFTYNSLICMSFQLPRMTGEFLMKTSVDSFKLTHNQVSLALAVMAVLSILLLAWLPESPKWLLLSHKVQEAEKVLNDIAVTNGKKIKVEVVIHRWTQDSRIGFDGALIHEDIVEVKLNNEEFQEKIFLERRSYSLTSLFNPSLLTYTVIFSCIYLLIPLNGISSYGVPPSTNFALGVAGILFTMVIEGIIGRRNCLLIYTTLIFFIAMVTDLVQDANSKVLSDKLKEQNVTSINYIIRFLSQPLKSLIYLMTLSIYPSALRTKALAVFTVFRQIPLFLRPLVDHVIPYYTGHGPYFWLAIVAMSSAIFSYYLPEPLNFDLPNTIEDTLYMDQRKSKWFPFRNKRAR